MYVNAGCVHRAAARWRANGHVLSNPAHASAFTHTKIVRKDILGREHILITYSSAFTQTKREISLPSKGCLVNKTQMHRREESAYATSKFASLTPSKVPPCRKQGSGRRGWERIKSERRRIAERIKSERRRCTRGRNHIATPDLR